MCFLHLFSHRCSVHWYLQGLKKYLFFSGRARRNEFWMFQIYNVLVAFIILPIISVNLVIILGGSFEIFLIAYGLSMGIYSLGTGVPSLAVSVRRLHDIGRSGWWLLIGLVPVASLILIFWYLSDSKAEENKYGPNPKEISPSD